MPSCVHPGVQILGEGKWAGTEIETKPNVKYTNKQQERYVYYLVEEGGRA